MHLAMSSMPEKIKRLNKLFESHYRLFSQSIEENISIQATDKMLLNMASLKKKPAEEVVEEKEPEIPEDIKLLTEIRDLLKKD